MKPNMFIMRKKGGLMHYPLILLVLFWAGILYSCQQDEITADNEMLIKMATINEITLIYPDEAKTGEDFNIKFSSSCGKVMIERGYINGNPIMEGDLIVGYEKVYVDLTCETKSLKWEHIGSSNFLSCSGGTVTETWDETGTYIYRVKLNQKAYKGSDCLDCSAFKGILFQCFMVRVVEGNSGKFTDVRDSKKYKWVKIGNQVWMGENLAWLPSVSPPAAGSITNPYYYVFGYDGSDVSAAKATANYATYGVLCNWPAALNACPEGWHLPSDAEWTTLTDYLGGTLVAGGKMKEAGTSHWTPTNYYATNESGFTALPGANRGPNGVFYGIGWYGSWWSSTEYSADLAWDRDLHYNLTIVFPVSYNKGYGFSVRCLRD